MVVWVYRIKFKYDDPVERYKAHLIAKGHTQPEGLDFFETYSPVAKLVIVKLLLLVVANRKWPLIQHGVNNAFLNGDLFVEV